MMKIFRKNKPGFSFNDLLVIICLNAFFGGGLIGYTALHLENTSPLILLPALGGGLGWFSAAYLVKKIPKLFEEGRVYVEF